MKTDRSMLDILINQKLGQHEQKGIRVRFHQELIHKVKFEQFPYHYCALMGNDALACYLYYKGVPLQAAIKVVSFASNGLNNDTPWNKEVTVSPSEAALLAGHNSTCFTLQAIEKGIPLAWDRSVFKQYPEDFQKQVQEYLSGLMSSCWFIEMPGPVRTRLVDIAVNQMAEQEFWGCLNWEQSWSDMIQKDDLKKARRLVKNGLKQPSNRAQNNQYQIQLNRGDRCQWRKRLVKCTVRAGLSVVALIAGQKFGQQSRCYKVLSCVNPTAALLYVGVQSADEGDGGCSLGGPEQSVQQEMKKMQDRAREYASYLF
eukprot:TRINITY_DN11384_c0_g2_i1.p1 TRINITY_DN11384_c0_g2~~TRINITY_DN11384_c0_g2_i1.p1  ORF type:complete len:314 (+),score=48.40 TRINITY_DN11384_c0_g2_i1:185-1126(+)